MYNDVLPSFLLGQREIVPSLLFTRTYSVALSFSLSLLRRTLITSLRLVTHLNPAKPQCRVLVPIRPPPSRLDQVLSILDPVNNALIPARFD